VNLIIPQADRYVIWARPHITATTAGTATCKLVAATETDTSPSQGLPPTTAFTLSNLVVHDPAAGSVDCRCATSGALPTNFVKIATIRVGNLTNSG